MAASIESRRRFAGASFSRSLTAYTRMIDGIGFIGGAKAEIAFSGAPHRPGIIYTVKANEAIAKKN